MTVLTVALIAVSGNYYLVQEADSILDALAENWKDAKFWIVTDGVRTGWQRYQIKWSELDGEKVLLVDYERATSRFWSERFRAWLQPNKTLSPRMIQWGNGGYQARVKDGIMAMVPFPRGTRAPDNLAIFPELAASLMPLKRDANLAFTQLTPGGGMIQAGPFIVSSKEKKPEISNGEVDVWKVLGTTTHRKFDNAESWDWQLWFRGNRSLALARCGIKYKSFDGEKREIVEELIPVDDKEWNSDDLTSNETRALASLCLLAELAGHFRQFDMDENSLNDNWVGDVSGLFRLIPNRGKGRIELIPREVAMADSAPLAPGPERGGASISESLCERPTAAFGYYFRALTKVHLDNQAEVLNDGSNRHSSLFGFCAFPAQYKKTGRRTFVITAEKVPMAKDQNGEAVKELEADPEKHGWRTVGPLR